MKILVISDIHSNWAALSAIQEPFDACLCVGDLVDYATNPLPCVNWVRRHALTTVRGNHDHAIAQRIQPKGGSGLRGLAQATRPMHWEVLKEPHLNFLATLPVTTRIKLDGTTFFLVHGTPRDPMDEYLTDDKKAWKSRLKDVGADIVLVGHSHVPFHLDLGETQVLNPGSVGQPRDGDPRCSYAVIENGRVEIRRVEYDIDATLKQMQDSGVSAEYVEFAETILRTGSTAH